VSLLLILQLLLCIAQAILQFYHQKVTAINDVQYQAQSQRYIGMFSWWIVELFTTQDF